MQAPTKELFHVEDPYPAGTRPRRASARRAAVLAMVLAATLAGTLGSAPTVQADGPGPAPAACPAGLATKAKCYTGRDTNGAYYTMAVPKRWNGSLVVHAHGGPDFAYDASPHYLLGGPAMGRPAFGVGMTFSPCRTYGLGGGVTGSGGIDRPLIRG
ncbi:hypothetical protein ACFWHX_27650, partial [Streptomyces hirsutus]